MRTQTKEIQAALAPQRAVELLKEGNARFQANLKANRNLLEQVNITADGQYPSVRSGTVQFQDMFCGNAG
jgi:carbonic anhydrase